MNASILNNTFAVLCFEQLNMMTWNGLLYNCMSNISLNKRDSSCFQWQRDDQVHVHDVDKARAVAFCLCDEFVYRFGSSYTIIANHASVFIPLTHMKTGVEIGPGLATMVLHLHVYFEYSVKNPSYLCNIFVQGQFYLAFQKIFSPNCFIMDSRSA